MKSYLKIFLIFIVALFTSFLFLDFTTNNSNTTYAAEGNHIATINVTGYTNEVLMNPGKGFTSMYESIDNNCINLISTMYYRFDWDEIEHEEGVYRWDYIDYFITRAKQRNKKIAFGVMNASTSADSPYVTPKWVFDKGAQYTTATNEYGNMQYIPVWDDPIYLAEMNKFIEALGERYDGNEDIAFIDIRNYGNWGEQHNWGLWESEYVEPEQLKELFIQPYIDSFPNTLLVIPWGIRDYDEVYRWAIDNGVSIRRDGIMEKDDEYVGGYEVFQYASGKHPTMFEYHEFFRNKIENREDLNMEYLWQYILDWRPTYIEMLPELYQEEPQWTEKIANKVGYYFKYTGGQYQNVVSTNQDTTISIDFLNDGVAPLFEPCTVYLGLLDSNNNLVKKIKTNVEANKWMPNITKRENITISYNNVDAGHYKLALGLFLNENDANPTYLIANNGKTNNNWYVIGEVTINSNYLLGDVDYDNSVTAFDAYLALKYSLQDNLSDEIIRIADIDKDNMITAFDAYNILKMSINV